VQATENKNKLLATLTRRAEQWDSAYSALSHSFRALCVSWDL